VNLRRTFDTHALSAAFPFASPDLPLSDGGTGVLYGLNLASSGVVVWDRWAQHNYNSVILARSGSGKSFFAKLDLLRSLYHGVEAAVIDPEDEYLALAEAVGGVVIRPGAPGVRINPLDLSPDDGADALMRRALFMHTFVQVLTAGEHGQAEALPPREAAALDAAVLAAYQAKGITTDPRTWRRPAPLLSDLAAALQGQGEAGAMVAARLQPYVTGSFSGMFSGPTTAYQQGHLVVYAIAQLPEELQPAGSDAELVELVRQIAATVASRRSLSVAAARAARCSSSARSRYDSRCSGSPPVLSAVAAVPANAVLTSSSASCGSPAKRQWWLRLPRMCAASRRSPAAAAARRAIL
jgi:hypothetical protein